MARCIWSETMLTFLSAPEVKDDYISTRGTEANQPFLVSCTVGFQTAQRLHPPSISSKIKVTCLMGKWWCICSLQDILLCYRAVWFSSLRERFFSPFLCTDKNSCKVWCCRMLLRPILLCSCNLLCKTWWHINRSVPLGGHTQRLAAKTNNTGLM